MTENELNSINSGEPLKEEATGSVPTADDQQTGQPAAQQEETAGQGAPSSLQEPSVASQPAAGIPPAHHQEIPQGAPYTPPPTPHAGGGQPPYQQPAGGYYPPYYYYPYPTSQPPVPPIRRKKSAVKIVAWIVAAVLELALIGFAAYGVYSLCTFGGAGSSRQENWFPNYQQGQDDGGQLPGNSATPELSAKMGLTCQEFTDAMAQRYDLESGLLVVEIEEDSDAQAKGVEKYDIITHMDGNKISSFNDYYSFMEDKNPGDEVELTILRPAQQEGEENQTITVTITLAERQTDASSSQTTPGYPKT